MAACEFRPNASREEQGRPGLQTPQADVDLFLWVNIVEIRIPQREAHHICDIVGPASLASRESIVCAVAVRSKAGCKWQAKMRLDP